MTSSKIKITFTKLVELLSKGFVSPLNSKKKSVHSQLLDMGGEISCQDRIYIELDMFPKVFDVQVETNCTDEEAGELHKKMKLSSLSGNHVFVVWHGDNALHGWEARQAVIGRPFYCLTRGEFINTRFDAII